MASRIVLDSNKLWLFPWSDGTMSVRDPGNELNTHDIPRNLYDWPHVGRVGTNAASTHRELEVFGVVFSGKKLQDLVKEMINHQVLVNREGFMVMYFNIGAGNMYIARDNSSLVRRLNDLFDWSKYGVNVPTPVETVWDRFQLNTGKLMVDNKGALASQKKLEEQQKENEKLKQELEEAKRKSEEEKKAQDEQIEKQRKELEEKEKELAKAKKANEAKDKENAELKAKQAADAEEIKKLKEDVAAKDKQIAALRNALQAFL
ncbi:hypothetical protein LINGRAHAP2_LOCUS11703 [Linum grandiflorum]